MSTLVLTLITGVGLGALYFLVASGLSLIYGLMHVLNFAHGAFLTLSAFMGFMVAQALGTDSWASFLLSVLVGAAVSHDCLLDLPRRILVDAGAARKGCAESRAPGLSELERAVGVAVNEYALHGDLRRRIARDEPIAQPLARIVRHLNGRAQLTKLHRVATPRQRRQRYRTAGIRLLRDQFAKVPHAHRAPGHRSTYLDRNRLARPERGLCLQQFSHVLSLDRAGGQSLHEVPLEDEEHRDHR